MKKIIVLISTLILMLGSILFASNEIWFQDAGGLTKCYTITNDANKAIYNFTASTFAVWVDKASRSATLTWDGNSFLYQATPPASLGAGTYILRSYDSNTTLFDPNTTVTGGCILPWSGTAILNPAIDANIAAQGTNVWTVETRTLTATDKTGVTLTDPCQAVILALGTTPQDIYNIVKPGGTGDANATRTDANKAAKNSGGGTGGGGWW